MQLENFGSILSFALELESEDAAFYQKAMDNPDCSDCRELFQQLVHEGKKQEKALARSRQENVTEMILESINGLRSSEFEVERPAPESVSRTELLATAERLEGHAASFYSQAAEKLQPLSAGVARTFSRLSKKRGERKERLGSIS